MAVDVATPDGRVAVLCSARHRVHDGDVVVSHVDLLGGVGDLLAERAAAALGSTVTALHVAGGRPRRPRQRAGDGAPDLLGPGDVARPVTELVDGGRVRQLAGEGRRLAWFPRPLGAQHAVAVEHGATQVRVERRPGLRDAGTHVALRAWRAELLQAVAARSSGAGTVRPGEHGLLHRVVPPLAGAWSLVAEAHGPAGVERCWATGDDDVLAVVELLDVLAEVLATHQVVVPARRLAAADVLEAGVTLDRLAAAGVLRWGRVPPQREAVAGWLRGGG